MIIIFTVLFALLTFLLLSVVACLIGEAWDASSKLWNKIKCIYRRGKGYPWKH